MLNIHTNNSLDASQRRLAFVDLYANHSSFNHADSDSQLERSNFVMNLLIQNFDHKADWQPLIDKMIEKNDWFVANENILKMNPNPAQAATILLHCENITTLNEKINKVMKYGSSIYTTDWIMYNARFLRQLVDVNGNIGREIPKLNFSGIVINVSEFVKLIKEQDLVNNDELLTKYAFCINESLMQPEIISWGFSPDILSYLARCYIKIQVLTKQTAVNVKVIYDNYVEYKLYAEELNYAAKNGLEILVCEDNQIFPIHDDRARDFILLSSADLIFKVLQNSKLSRQCLTIVALILGLEVDLSQNTNQEAISCAEIESMYSFYDMKCQSMSIKNRIELAVKIQKWQNNLGDNTAQVKDKLNRLKGLLINKILDSASNLSSFVEYLRTTEVFIDTGHKDVIYAIEEHLSNPSLKLVDYLSQQDLIYLVKYYINNVQKKHYDRKTVYLDFMIIQNISIESIADDLASAEKKEVIFQLRNFLNKKAIEIDFLADNNRELINFILSGIISKRTANPDSETFVSCFQKKMQILQDEKFIMLQKAASIFDQSSLAMSAKNLSVLFSSKTPDELETLIHKFSDSIVGLWPDNYESKFSFTNLCNHLKKISKSNDQNTVLKISNIISWIYSVSIISLLDPRAGVDYESVFYTKHSAELRKILVALALHPSNEQRSEIYSLCLESPYCVSKFIALHPKEHDEIMIISLLLARKFDATLLEESKSSIISNLTHFGKDGKKICMLISMIMAFPYNSTVLLALLKEIVTEPEIAISSEIFYINSKDDIDLQVNNKIADLLQDHPSNCCIIMRLTDEANNESIVISAVKLGLRINTIASSNKQEDIFKALTKAVGIWENVKIKQIDKIQSYLETKKLITSKHERQSYLVNTGLGFANNRIIVELQEEIESGKKINLEMYFSAKLNVIIASQHNTELLLKKIATDLQYAELISYAAGLYSLKDSNPIYHELFIKYLGYALTGNIHEYKSNRYATDHNLHLKALAESSSLVYSKWQENYSERLSNVISSDSFGQQSTDGNLNLEAYFYDKIINHKHLPRDGQFTLIYEYLSAECTDENRQQLKSDLSILLKQATDQQASNLLLMQKLIMSFEATSIQQVQALLGDIETLNLGNIELLNDIKALQLSYKSKEYLEVDKSKIEFTDNYWRLLMAGTQVNGSCQRLGGFTNLNKCLMMYLTGGHDKIICISDARDRIVMRAIIRLCLDQQTNKPVAFLERTYNATGCPSNLVEVIKRYAIDCCAKIGCDLVTASDAAFTKGAEKYPNAIAVNGLPFAEYVDAKRGQYQDYSIENSALLFSAKRIQPEQSNTDQYLISELTFEDISSAKKLDAQLYPEALCWTDAYWNLQLNRALFKQAIRLQADHSMVGNIIARKLSDSVQIETISIATEYQRQGLGIRLMHALAKSLESMLGTEMLPGVNKIKLSVLKDNTQALNLYNKCGFELYDKDSNKLYMSQTIQKFVATINELKNHESVRPASHRMHM